MQASSMHSQAGIQRSNGRQSSSVSIRSQQWNGSSGGSRSFIDVLSLLQQMEVEEKYVQIQRTKNYLYEEIEKWSEEEFIENFQAETKEEMAILSDIFMRLKTHSLPESYELQRQISISDEDAMNPTSQGRSHVDSSTSQFAARSRGSNSNLLRVDHPQKQSLFNFGRRTSHLSPSNLLGPSNNFVTHSEYQYPNQMNSRNEIRGLSYLSTKLSETILFNQKYLPYDPFDFSSAPPLSNLTFSNNNNNTLAKSAASKALTQAQISSMSAILQQVSDVLSSKPSLRASMPRSPHLFVRTTHKDNQDKTTSSICNVVLPNTESEIGRNAKSEVTLTDAQVSRSHAKIIAKPDGYSLMDLGSGQGTFIRIRKGKRHVVQVGTIFKCGSTEFKITRVILEETSIGVSIRINCGNKKNTQTDFQITSPIRPLDQDAVAIVNIGSSQSNNNVFAIDLTLDKKHASILFQAGQLFMVDLNSTSGTWVRLSPSKQPSIESPLKDGQQFMISPYLLTVFIQK